MARNIWLITANPLHFEPWGVTYQKWLQEWNAGESGYQGTFDFFEEWSDRDIAGMVLGDRNHPSVVMWSIGNEVDYPNNPYTHPILSGSRFNQPVTYLGHCITGRDDKKALSDSALPVWDYADGDMVWVVCYTNVLNPS